MTREDGGEKRESWVKALLKHTAALSRSMEPPPSAWQWPTKGWGWDEMKNIPEVHRTFTKCKAPTPQILEAGHESWESTFQVHRAFIKSKVVACWKPGEGHENWDRYSWWQDLHQVNFSISLEAGGSVAAWREIHLPRWGKPEIEVKSKGYFSVPWNTGAEL